jgi:RimJ/RimL family protein N-acetyltransferase
MPIVQPGSNRRVFEPATRWTTGPGRAGDLSWLGLRVKELTTDRLLLRRFTSDDSDFIFDMYSRWEVQRFIGLTPRLMTERAEAEERTARYAAFERENHQQINV